MVCLWSVTLRSTRRVTYNDGSDTVTRDFKESGRPGSNWHHQLGRVTDPDKDER